MLEILRLLGCYLILVLPLTICLLTGSVYLIGVKIGIFKE